MRDKELRNNIKQEKGETDLMSGPSGNDAGGMKRPCPYGISLPLDSGAIIGTGWVLLVGDWMVIGGGPIAAMIAFAIGAVFPASHRSRVRGADSGHPYLRRNH